jgi:polyhydroxybutyrate depolymerase
MRLILKILLLIAVIALIVGAVRRYDQNNPDGGSAEESAETEGETSQNSNTFTFGPGEYTREIESDGRTRKYTLTVPTSYNPSSPTPLVMVYHGGGGTMNYSQKEYGWDQMAEEKGIIVASMNGTSALPGDVLSTWNAGSCCGYARDKNIDDVAYIRVALKDIQANFNVEDGAVFATGFSNGGMLSHRLACEASDVIDAVAALAGTVGVTTCAPAREIPVMHIHAIDDTHVLFNGGAGKDSFNDLSQVTEFVSVPDTAQFWIDTYGLDATPERIYDNKGAYCDRYTGSTQGGSFTLCVTPDGGHSWPGADSPSHGGAIPSETLDGNEVIWEFFMGEF